MSLTSPEVTPAAPHFPLQQHALGGHPGIKCGLNIVHKRPAVRAVHPDSLPQRVFDVHLQEPQTQAAGSPRPLDAKQLSHQWTVPQSPHEPLSAGGTVTWYWDHEMTLPEEGIPPFSPTLGPRVGSSP